MEQYTRSFDQDQMELTLQPCIYCYEKYGNHYMNCIAIQKCFSCGIALIPYNTHHMRKCCLMKAGARTLKLYYMDKKLNALNPLDLLNPQNSLNATILCLASITRILPLLPINIEPITDTILLFLGVKNLCKSTPVALWLSEQINVRIKLKDQQDKLVSKSLKLYKELIQLREEENRNCRRLLCMQPREQYAGNDNTHLQKVCMNALVLAKEYAKDLYRENIKFNAIIAEKRECIVAKLANLHIKHANDLYRKNKL